MPIYVNVLTFWTTIYTTPPWNGKEIPVKWRPTCNTKRFFFLLWRPRFIESVASTSHDKPKGALFGMSTKCHAPRTHIQHKYHNSTTQHIIIVRPSQSCRLCLGAFIYENLINSTIGRRVVGRLTENAHIQKHEAKWKYDADCNNSPYVCAAEKWWKYVIFLRSVIDWAGRWAESGLVGRAQIRYAEHYWVVVRDKDLYRERHWD